MHKKFTYIVTLLLLHICSYAQPSMKRSRIAFTTGLNTNDAYDGEFSYHYMLLPYLGIGSGIGYFNQWYNDYLPHGKASGQWTSWKLSESDKEIGKVYLRPSILLSTPSLFKLGKYAISFQGECGAQILIPHTGVYIDYFNYNTFGSKSKYKSTNKGEWIFWSVKGGVNLSFNDIAIGLGYGISNLDIYSSRRIINVENVSLSDFYPERRMTHSLFLCFMYSL